VIKTVLVVLTWLQGAPVVQTQTLESPQECRVVAEATVQMMQKQAQTNMMAPHNALTVAHDEKPEEWTLNTGAVGREVARLRCVPVDAPSR
jgi:hypothetical protein